MKAYLLLACLAFAFTYLATPIVTRIALATRALTPVRERDVHTHPIPRLGGIAMLTGVVGTLLVGSRFPYFREFFTAPQPWVVLVGAIAICALGVVDDLWDLEWWTKLAGQFLVAGAVAWGGVQVVSFPLFGVTIGSSRLSILVSVLVIVVAANAVNFVDGLDGLAAGTMAIGAGGFFVYTYMLIRLTDAQSYASFSAMLMVILTGVCVGFLFFNFHPATIFMGDNGSMLLGYMAGVAFITVTGQIDPTVLGHSQLVPAILPLALPVAVVLLPLLDMIMAVVRRVRAGQAPFHPDRLHLHHRMLAACGSHRLAVLVLYGWSAGVTGAALSFMILPARWALAVTGLVAVGVGLATVALLPGLRARYFGGLQR